MYKSGTTVKLFVKNWARSGIFHFSLPLEFQADVQLLHSQKGNVQNEGE
jgi:hypothetical protein